MNALQLTAPSTLEFTEVPEPAPAPDEVLIRIRACGICGSDLHGWNGSTGRRRPPLIMGHEAAGEIAALGAEVSGWEVGERVTFDSTRSCGECPSCRAGRVNLCEERRVFGVAPAEYSQDGAFAERLAVPARLLYRLPEKLGFTEAAMIEPVSIAVHAVLRAQVKAGDTAVVVGAGMIGLLVVQALRWAGAARLVRGTSLVTDALAARYPALRPQLDRGVSVAIDGKVYNDSWFQPIREDSEVVLLARLKGG